MTTKAHRLIPQILAAVLILFGAVACSTTASTPPTENSNTQTESKAPATVFKCVKEGSGWATIVERGTPSVSPLITWNTTEFGEEYGPEKRCNLVSEKLTKAVANNGGKLGYLKLNVGSLKNQNVVCFLNRGEKNCNSENLLFTLNQKNSQSSKEVLTKIVNVSYAKATNKDIIEENGGSAWILLDNLIIEPKF